MDLRVLASPHYFGPVERRRFGMVHWPECPVRGSALIFPPVGYESVCTHQSLRVLAESMARRGIVAFRVDYDGCGNSIGDDSDEDRVASWLQSVVDAHEELLSFQCGTPVVVGLRLGATLAATRLGADPRVRGLAFWDPIGQGRRYARSLRLFAAASTESEHDQTVVGGIHFTNDTLAAIGALRLEVGALVSTGLLIERGGVRSSVCPSALDVADRVDARDGGDG